MRIESLKTLLSEVTGMENRETTEYISEKQARAIRSMFTMYLKSYREKEATLSDADWLEQLFKSELPEIQESIAKQDALEIVQSISVFDSSLTSVNEATQKGISKERWLAEKLQESSVGMAVNEYGQKLKAMDDILYHKNMELAEALQRSADGHIKMSPNLDGNIAENMIAHTSELSGFLKGKNIKVEIRDVFTPNSVDVRATNLHTGEYQNYQLKFGKDAKATIDLIERGNYNNQQIIVPSEQLKDIQAHFKAKGSLKTISDHIDAWGAKGKSFTKQEMKELQISAQNDGIVPEMNYSHYQTTDLAMSIGKNASAMALQSVAVTTGLNIAHKIFNGEKVDADEMVAIAFKTGADTSIKVVAAGTLQVAIRREIIGLIPKATPAGVIANIACVGIENIKILGKIASGEVSFTKGLDQMGHVTVSMVGGLLGTAKGAVLGASLTAWIPVIGMPLAVVTGFVGGMVGYFGGSKLGEAIYNTGKKVAKTAKSVAKVAVSGLKSAGRAVASSAKSAVRAVASIFGF